MTACTKFELAILEFGVKNALEYFATPKDMWGHFDDEWERGIRKDAGIEGAKNTEQQLQLLQEGDVIELKDEMTVYAMVPEHFVHSNRRGSFKLTDHCVKIGGEFDYLAGKYVVTKTTMDGGGTGRGQHDVYPDGHHVFCVKVDDENTKIDFYQSGFFTAMIENIKPIGKAKLKKDI